MTLKSRLKFEVETTKSNDVLSSTVSVYLTESINPCVEVGSAKIFSLLNFSQKSKKEKSSQFDQCSSSCSEFQYLIEDAFSECLINDSETKALVFIEEIIILPRFQSQGIGTETFLFILNNFLSENSVLALEACPVGKLERYLSIVNINLRASKIREDIDNLITWYKGFGLRKIQDSDYMITTSSEVLNQSRIKLRAA